MQFPRLAGHRRPVVTLLAAAVVAAGVAVSGGSAFAAAADASSLYLVQVAGAPLATYTGDVAGLAATQPVAGEQVDATSTAAMQYRDHLKGKHNDVLRSAGIAATRTTADYGVTFNGFAARLSVDEAARLAHQPGVIKVWPDEILTVDTVSTPHFLGLDGPDGVWTKEFGGGVARAGEGVVVGVIDSGIWPENAAFGPLPEPRPDAKTIAKKWHGTCQAAEEAGTGVPCNNKLIGARFYHQSVNVRDAEFVSPRDFNGHGSHTASTAAGNNGVAASINGGSVGSISGMAPAARIAAYKVLWDTGVNGQASGGTADIVQAIEDAVADGVDVINYSISGSTQSFVDPVEIAYFNAAAAGVFVAASAGNNGPGAATVAHNSPWLTTVAASSHDRGSVKMVTLGNGASYMGVGVGPGVGPASLIRSVDAGLPGQPASNVQLCFLGSLDPAKVAGKIVVCDRGVNARVEKSQEVASKGGAGMILANIAGGSNGLSADFHSVPSIHLAIADGDAVKTYMAGTTTPTATISAQSTDPVRAPAMADFSSAGPALAGGGDLLKPDITAPGVDVIAAVAPPGNLGNNFNALSGTSMSSPHIAGIAALLKSANPSWSPMWIKSALMTNASPLDNTGQPIQRGAGNATPLDYGSGHVVPANAFDPGLVYDSSPLDWARFGCGTGQFQLAFDPALCAAVGSVDPSDLNYPSLSIGDLTGAQTLTRTVTNADNGVGWYTATIQAPPGFSATVTPANLKVLPHRSATFKVTITRTTAPLGSWAFGSLTLSDGTGGHRGHVVRSPIAVRAVALGAPGEVGASGVSGSRALSLKIGYNGQLNASVNGLVPATTSATVLDTTGPGFNSNAPAASSRTAMVPVTIPAGTLTARFATFDADYPLGTDVDLSVYRVVGTSRILVGSSGGGTAEESVTLSSPVAGAYEFYANLFAVPSGTTGTVHPFHWVLGPGASNVSVAPASQAVTIASTATVTVTWSGLAAGNRYLGVVSFDDGTTVLGRSMVTITS